MFRFLLLSHSFRHPAQFPAGAFDLALRPLPLCGVHLRQSFGEPAAGTPQDGKRHFQIALYLFERGGFCRLRLPLRFQNSSGSARMRSRTTRQPSRQAV
jgi:hypothetical protein